SERARSSAGTCGSRARCRPAPRSSGGHAMSEVPMSEAHTNVARALFAAIAAGDVAAVAALYHDDALVFMNTTGATLSKRKMLGVIRFLSTQVSELRYEDVRVQPTPTGFVQQH